MGDVNAARALMDVVVERAFGLVKTAAARQDDVGARANANALNSSMQS